MAKSLQEKLDKKLNYEFNERENLKQEKLKYLNDLKIKENRDKALLAKIKSENAKKKKDDVVNKAIEQKLKINFKNGNIDTGCKAYDELIDPTKLSVLSFLSSVEKKVIINIQKEDKKNIKTGIASSSTDKGKKLNKSILLESSSDEESKAAMNEG